MIKCLVKTIAAVCVVPRSVPGDGIVGETAASLSPGPCEVRGV